MKELLQHGMKVQTMQAWGWFIRLLGSHAMKNRNLVNEMLKIPEQAFSDHDPQFQIAALVYFFYQLMYAFQLLAVASNIHEVFQLSQMYTGLFSPTTRKT